ncbi:2OG-Fe(II) oxygenase family protein [Patescibacteria group bacterium]|nr:2OG-Fe(II) oxygenase family protein [Patescibacteria group bacterium]
MPTSYQDIVNDLNAQSFHRMALTCTQEEIKTAVDAFFRFMTLPEETKQKYSFRIDPEDRGTEVGYWTRSRAAGNKDNRGYFHYSLVGDERFRKEGADCKELIEFLDAAKPLYEKVTMTLREAVQAIDQGRGTQLVQRIFEPGSGLVQNIPLRFLAYTQTEPGDFLATGHYDRGIVSLAIAESAPGLRMGKTPDTVKDIIHEPGYGLFFPGINLQDLTDETFAPSWHDVIQKDVNAFQPGCARWAVVLFAHAWNLSYKTWETCHTPQY